MVGAGDVAARAMRFLPKGVSVIALVRRPEAATAWRERGAKVLIADQERLDRVAAKANGFGWGYGDHINWAVEELAASLDA